MISRFWRAKQVIRQQFLGSRRAVIGPFGRRSCNGDAIQID